MEKVFSPDGDAMLWLRIPDATNAVEEKRVGQGGTEHVAWPGDYNSNTNTNYNYKTKIIILISRRKEF